MKNPSTLPTVSNTKRYFSNGVLSAIAGIAVFSVVSVVAIFAGAWCFLDTGLGGALPFIITVSAPIVTFVIGLMCQDIL